MPFDGLVILFGLAWEVISGLLLIVGVVVASVGVTAALIIVLYVVVCALVRRSFGLRRGPQLQGDREEQGFITEWLR
ncbi:hypothetical protein [Microtetraspora niveoalba]|uniref:hypothetical protein n=1 Tax=Microtetraspora niveoalba TaxID=46175 RepID=UPI000832BE5E|nr:hypothetical protein [Microtetraspora niveoalba]